VNFGEKISKLLRINAKEFATIEDLEVFVGVGRHTIRKSINENREPSRRILAKIIEGLDMTQEDWDANRFERTKKIEKSKEDRDLIPFYDAVAVGGVQILADQTPVSGPTEMIEPGTWFKQASGALRVYGHSMFPKYPAGCIVAFKISTSTVIVWGEDYVIELSDRRIVKRVEPGLDKDHIKAVSYNINKDQKYVYDPIEIPKSEIKRMYIVLGKVELEASI
jgi:phage repressor protein C with HTH and peptisase S24 domain